MRKNKQIHRLLLVLLILASCKEPNSNPQPENKESKAENKSEFQPVPTGPINLSVSNTPSHITRTIIEDRNGNIWLAAFDGVFKYDGKSFMNMSKEVSQSRFFSALEDSSGNLWFGSIGSGVFRYDGKSFQNFTTDNGLLNNEVVSIYEDKAGNIWFGVNGGVSKYDGNSIQNYVLEGDTMIEDTSGKTIPNLQRPMNEVNSIIQDKSGSFWFATRGKTFKYDGKTFATVTQNGKPFSNVRWAIEDKKGAIWLGGNDGLWHYDGYKFDNITTDFVGHIYEDDERNIWTSSQSNGDWVLSRYDEKSFSSKTPTPIVLKSGLEGNRGMLFGILQTSNGTIWTGTLQGVYCYDGHTFSGFKG